jgi:hypothetical protein
MQIILKTDLKTNNEEIVNILYGENPSYINNWVNNYFEQEICSLKMAPYENEFIKKDSLDYFVEIENGMYYLVKKYKRVLKGYLYNSFDKISERLYSVRVMTYENTEQFLDEQPCDMLWNGINMEIIHRVMKQIDKESLFQLNMKFESAIKTKQHWTSTELIMLQCELIKTHKKNLYSSVVKKIKKIEKKHQNKNSYGVQNIQLPCKTIIFDENGINNYGGIMPNILKYAEKSCSLEYNIINNKDKYD